MTGGVGHHGGGGSRADGVAGNHSGGAHDFDVVVIGAGLSGIGAAWRLAQRCPWARFVVLESREAIGGTWDLFRYPGIRSDSDMFTLGYPFRPWDGHNTIAGGGDIRDYIAATATAGGIDRRIRFGRRVTAMEWSSVQGKWRLTVRDESLGTHDVVTCRFVVSCTGYYRYDRGHTPHFEGQDRFAGDVVHPQHWPDNLDVTGRKVVVVGSGATAVTLVPALAQCADHVTMLQRSPTWVVSRSTHDPMVDRLRRWLPKAMADRAIRRMHVAASQGSWRLSRRHPGMVKRFLLRSVAAQLPPGFDVDPHFTPTYDPWEQRLCVATDGDLFAAISSGRASVVTDRIESFTDNGIALASGTELACDVVVTATGLELLFMGGIDVSIDGAPVNVSDRLMYRGMMLEGVPNLVVAFGYANASWTLRADLTSQFAARLVEHLETGGFTSCTPVNSGVGAVAESVMGLSSGYVQRAAGVLPRQGAEAPWRVGHDYRHDRRAVMGYRFGDDPALVFAPVGEPALSDRPAGMVRTVHAGKIFLAG